MRVQSTRKKYHESGITAIKAIKMGCPPRERRKLTPEREAAIKAEITEKNPSESGLAGYLWGGAEVCETVKRRYGTEMRMFVTGDCSARRNFTYQRSEKRITAKTKNL